MSLETSLRYLHTFHPVSGVLLIGSGSGSLAPLILSLHVKEVILAEADREQIKRMQKVHTLPQEWKIVNAIVYKDTPSCEYYYTNNTSANGIVPVDVLKPIFPNLTLKSFELSNAISISTLLEQTKATQINWLMVDCYTQMSFFEENQTVLESFDVIVVRLLRNEKQTLDAWMNEQGFRSAEAYEESNPQVVIVVYLKDFSGRLELSHKLQKENQKRLNEAEVKSKALEETKQTLEQQLYELSTLKTQHSEESERYQKKEQAYKSEIDELKVLVTTLKKEKEARSIELAQLVVSKNEWQHRAENLEVTLKELDQKQSENLKKLESLTKEYESGKSGQEEYTSKINALIQKRDALVKENALLFEKQKALEEKVNLLSDAKIENLVNECMVSEDIFEVLDSYLLEDVLADDKKFELICRIAEMMGTKDRMQGVGLLNQARLFVSSDRLVASGQYERLSHLATMLNQLDLSVDFLIDATSAKNHSNYNKKIAEGYTRIRNASKKSQQHGHDLLIDYIIKNLPKDEVKEKLLIEIGTTRENVPRQGSTEQLAKLCKEKNIQFITVDMDPHNTRWANFVSERKNLDFKAITAKGEEYLKNDAEKFDFIFLDAYDFDHGKHSELRQTRYEKNLGSKIDETECHIMHLKCAYSVEEKLKEGGVVCIDDTWQDEDGNWTAKGTLAVPHLLSRGFQIIEARNRAILLKREKQRG